jgi:hypothetical protein
MPGWADPRTAARRPPRRGRPCPQIFAETGFPVAATAFTAREALAFRRAPRR